ncbi:MAG: succinate--CoA ligase subunit beta [Pleurocapsa sp. MO_226.B13]|nr:succinate--CoA ligase subunit beta [Pleurocapsa sp. MO_226.B13]
MELLEYQAKELFKMVGIPILPSQTIKDSRKIKQLQIPYPVVLKSQVRSGGRGKAGGVRFVANTIDAIAAARTIFNLSILGEYPEVILAEAHYNTEREFFLAIVLDYDLQCPVLLGSAYGGMNVNSLLANLQQVVVGRDFSLFFARRLAASMGLSGELICSVSEIIAKMYRLFEERDLDLIEINPLGVNTKGELMALDGKITINDRALARQPIVKSLNFSEYQKQNNNSLGEITDNLNKVGWHWLDWRNQRGKIAIICNSFDLAVLTWDLLSQNKVTPACGVVIDNHFTQEQNNDRLYQERFGQILTELESIEGLKAILVNIWETEAVSKEIVQTIAQYLQSSSKSTLASKSESIDRDRVVESNLKNSSSLQQSQSNVARQPQLKFVLRLLNQDSDSEADLSCQFEERLCVSNNLETAISKAIAVVKSS